MGEGWRARARAGQQEAIPGLKRGGGGAAIWDKIMPDEYDGDNKPTHMDDPPRTARPDPGTTTPSDGDHCNGGRRTKGKAKKKDEGKRRRESGERGKKK